MVKSPIRGFGADVGVLEAESRAALGLHHLHELLEVHAAAVVGAVQAVVVRETAAGRRGGGRRGGGGRVGAAAVPARVVAVVEVAAGARRDLRQHVVLVVVAGVSIVLGHRGDGLLIEELGHRPASRAAHSLTLQPHHQNRG